MWLCNRSLIKSKPHYLVILQKVLIVCVGGEDHADSVCIERLQEFQLERGQGVIG